MAERMMVATRDITTIYEGEPIEIAAGRTRCISSHSLVRSFPGAWKELPGREGEVRSAVRMCGADGRIVETRCDRESAA